MTSPLVLLASNDLFGIARITTNSFRLLFVVVETMPFSIVAFHENKSVAVTSFDETGSFDVSSANDARFEMSILDVMLEHAPDFIDLFAKGYLVVNRYVRQVVHDEGRIAVGKIHFANASYFDFFARRKFI